MIDFKWLIRFLTDVTLFVLFLRYLTYGYASYGSGPFFSFLYRATDGLCAPLRPLIPFRIRVQSDYTPLLSMVLLVIGRGILYSLADLMWARMPMLSTLGVEVRVSVTQFLNGAILVGVVFLMLGAAFLRAGGYYSGIFFRVISETSEDVFRRVRVLVRVGNEWVLFGVAMLFGCLVYAVLFGIVWLYPLVPYIFLGTVIRTAVLAIYVFIAVLFVAILMSWLSPDPYNPIVQALRALTEPSLSWARRVFPWARIEMFDLSPMLIFLILVVAQSVLLSVGGWIPGTEILHSYGEVRPAHVTREAEPQEGPSDPGVRP